MSPVKSRTRIWGHVRRDFRFGEFYTSLHPHPNKAEKDTGFTLAIACIHEGKFARGRSAPLANMSGIVMKFEITPGVCQSVLEAVTARKKHDMPRPRRKIPRIQPAHMSGFP